MESLFFFLHQILDNNYFLLVMDVASFTLKIVLFLYLSIKTFVNHKKTVPSSFLLLTLFSAACVDLAWISTLTDKIGHPIVRQQYIIFIGRLAWAFFVLQYHSMLLLLSTLITREYKNILYKNLLFLITSLFFILFFIVLPFVAWDLVAKQDRPPVEFLMYHACSIYLLLILMPVCLWQIFSDLRTRKIPIIIKQQCRMLLFYLIIPYLLSDLVNMNPIKLDYFTFVVQSQLFTGISTLILTYLLYFCVRRILNIRFLDVNRHIQSTLIDRVFNTCFKESLITLGGVNHAYEIAPIVETFLRKAFHVEEQKMQLFIRTTHHHENLLAQIKEEKKQPISPVMQVIEEAINSHHRQLFLYFKKESVIVYDEIDFVNFYEQEPFLNEMMQLLKSINCSVLIPIFLKDDLVAYIVIYDHARKEPFYGQADKEALVVYANYLGAIISTTQNKKMEILTEENKFLVKKVYYKNQYINHLQESIRTFLHPNQKKKVALFSYKGGYFSTQSKEAFEILPVNLNEDQGNKITKQCKELVQLALKDRDIKTTLIVKDNDEQMLAIALPHNEINKVALIITLPSVSDLVSAQLPLLQSMNDWDFILYLQTTKTGTLIHNLLPGYSKRLMQYKLDILKGILSKKALAIDCIPADILMAVSTIHQANNRTTLFTLDLLKDSDHELRLFGLNSMYGASEEPLLSSLDLGTLFINNIHKLSISAQEKLAIYIEYGRFSKLKSDITIGSDVQILVANPLAHMESSKFFSPEFAALLKDQVVVIPALSALDENDLLELIEGFSRQAITSHTVNTVFMLSEHEKKRIITERPPSITDLKQRIMSLITNKNRPPVTQDVVRFDPSFFLVDDTLIQAARLGKNALKEQRIMTILWHKFEKNQNKIATFLGVNRSSVNRRVKKYDLS